MGRITLAGFATLSALKYQISVDKPKPVVILSMNATEEDGDLTYYQARKLAQSYWRETND